MKKIVYFLTAFCLVYSCESSSNGKPKGEIVSGIAADDQTDEELKAEIKRIEQEELQRIQEEKSNITTLSFDKMEHDFGNVKADTDSKTVFIVTNTGSKPLIINEVTASCGCTMPEKPEKPILPGKSDKISVVFHPKPEQLNEIRKTITVTANTEPKVSTVSVRAFVEK